MLSAPTIEFEEEVLQMLLLSEGGFNTVIVGAVPLLSVDLIVMVFVLPEKIVCVPVGNTVNTGGSFEGSVIRKKKSTGICDLAVPLSNLSSTIITAFQRSSVVVDSAVLLSLTSHSIKPEELSVIPVGITKVPELPKNSAFVPQR